MREGRGGERGVGVGGVEQTIYRAKKYRPRKNQYDEENVSNKESSRYSL